MALAASLALVTPLALTQGTQAAQAALAATKRFGFNAEVGTGTAGQRSLSLQLAMGSINVRRIIVRWSTVEATKGTWDWSYPDAEYNIVLQAGAVPEIDVHGAPCWAKPSDTSCTSTAPDNDAPDTAYDSYWQDFVNQATARYPQAIGVEVWNEQNGDPITADRYTQLLQAAYTAVKNANSSMPVISGGLEAFKPNYAAYLATMFADGAGNYMDDIGLHDYPISQDSVGCYHWDITAFEDILNVVRADESNAAVSKPIWITEAGISTGTHVCTSWPDGVSYSEQNTDIQDMVSDVNADSDVPLMLIDNLVDDGVWDLGVYDITKTPKPSACWLSTAFGGTLGC